MYRNDMSLARLLEEEKGYGGRLLKNTRSNKIS
jgi:hypothetical protein